VTRQGREHGCLASLKYQELGAGQKHWLNHHEARECCCLTVTGCQAQTVKHSCHHLDILDCKLDCQAVPSSEALLRDRQAAASQEIILLAATGGAGCSIKHAPHHPIKALDLLLRPTAELLLVAEVMLQLSDLCLHCAMFLVQASDTIVVLFFQCAMLPRQSIKLGLLVSTCSNKAALGRAKVCSQCLLAQALVTKPDA
jgi:hypothetical protein